MLSDTDHLSTIAFTIKRKHFRGRPSKKNCKTRDFRLWMARRFATRTVAIRANRFTRIDSQKEAIFVTFEAIRANRLKPAIRDF